MSTKQAIDDDFATDHEDLFGVSDEAAALMTAMKETKFGQGGDEDRMYDAAPEVEALRETLDERDFHAGKIERKRKEPPLTSIERAEREAAEETEETEETEAQAEQEQEKAEPDPDAYDWSRFKLDDDTNAALAALKGDKARDLAGRLDLISKFDEVIDDFGEFYRGLGIPISRDKMPEHMRALVRMDHLASTNPEEYLRTVLPLMEKRHNRKIDVAKVFGMGPRQTAESNWYDDDDEEDEPQQQAQPAQQTQPFDPSRPTVMEEERQRARAIRAWADETDASGAKLRPHFEEVFESMGAMLHARQSQGKPVDMSTLQDVYTAAVYAHPELGKKQIELLRAQAEAEAERKRGAGEVQDGQRSVERAKRATRQPIGGQSTPAPGGRGNQGAALPPGASERDILEYVFRELE